MRPFRASCPVEKKLVSIVKAFSRKANILILDEPTASLDEHGKNILFQIMMHMFGMKTMLMQF